MCRRYLLNKSLKIYTFLSKSVCKVLCKARVVIAIRVSFFVVLCVYVRACVAVSNGFEWL